MLKELLYPLVSRVTFFNIFQYITFRAAYSAITALFIAFLFGPKIISLLERLNARQEIRTDGPQTHLVKRGTPIMGGLLMIVSVCCSVLVWQDLHNAQTWVALGTLVGFGALGFLDDFLKIFRRNATGLRAGVKFTGQVMLALAIAALIYNARGPHTDLLYVPFVKYPVLDLGAAYIPFSVLLLVGTSNAVNLTDGLDGLATGLVIIVAATFALLSYLSGRSDYAAYLGIPYVEGAGELSIVSLSLVGAAVGFLWYNAHPAEVFMGDTGSLALGGTIGAIALMVKKEILLMIVGGVFVIEACSVIIQVVSFRLTGRRVFKMAPLHHHFEMMGWAESKVVIRFWILGGLFAIISLSTLKIQ